MAMAICFYGHGLLSIEFTNRIRFQTPLGSGCSDGCNGHMWMSAHISYNFTKMLSKFKNYVIESCVGAIVPDRPCRCGRPRSLDRPRKGSAKEPLMYTIKVISSAQKIKGQGVGSCYEEQVRLIKCGLRGKFDIQDAGRGSDDDAAGKRKQRAADINHYHTIDPTNFIGNLCKSQKTVSVGYVHFLPETVDDSLRMPATIRKLFNGYLVLFYKSMDYLVTVNPSYVAKLERYGVDPARVAYIPNFVSCDGFGELAEDEVARARRSLGIEPGQFAALGVGQLQTRKGVADFVEVARMLPHIAFIWAGGFSFGMMTSGYEKIRDIVADPPPNVRFLGIVQRSMMNGIYNACDALFLPSYSELFPMTVLEAMCCKKPLLLRDIDAYPPILFDGYLKGRCNEEFAEALARLAGDAEFHAEWTARSWACHERYAGDRVLGMWDEFYTKVLDARKRKLAGRQPMPWRQKQAVK